MRRPTAEIRALSLLSALVGLVAAACSTAPDEKNKEKQWMEYLETVRRLEEEGVTLESDSEEEREAVDRFQSALSDFKAPDFQDKIREVYAEELFFNDTLKTVLALEELVEYFAASADAVDTATVEFLDLTVQNGNYYFRWQMSLGFKSFERGQISRSIGMSHIRFDREGRVVLHQDFWDSAGGFFEHLPALGWMIRKIKKSL